VGDGEELEGLALDRGGRGDHGEGGQAYATLNARAAAALLATAGFFWYQLFGDLAATLTRDGPAGWAALAAAAIILGRPAAAARITRELYGAPRWHKHRRHVQSA
jgi:hypothetical protein